MDVHENNDYLAHYGVKGMKWGVRRYEDENGRLTAAGRRRYGVGDPRTSGGEEPSGRKKSSGSSVSKTKSRSKKTESSGSRTSKPTQKTVSKSSNDNSGLSKAAKVAALVGGAALMAGGVYALTKTPQGRKLILNGKNFLNSNTLLKKSINVKAEAKPNSSVLDDVVKPSKTKSKIDPKTGFKLQSDDMAKMSVADHAKQVNPNYSLSDRRSYMNCGNCTFAMEMRMRGFDVKASGLSTGQQPAQIGQFFKNLSDDSFHAMDLEISRLDMPDAITRANSPTERMVAGAKVEAALQQSIAKAFPDDNARGALTFTHVNGSHYIYWVKENGKVTFYDAQNPKNDLKYDLFGLYNYVPNKDWTRAVRLDNLEINYDEMKNIVQNSDELFRNSNFNVAVNKGENFISYDADVKKYVDEINEQFREMENDPDYEDLLKTLVG